MKIIRIFPIQTRGGNVKDKRLKKKLIAKTVAGMEEVLERELIAAGASSTKILNRAVGFEGDTAVMYRANYCCRTALRILLPVANFPVLRQEDLYEKLLKMEWEQWFKPNFTLAVDAVISGSVFTNSQFVAQKTKDAVVDRLRSVWGTRPSVDLEKPDLRINVHLFKENCTVSLDSSGGTLHKRGYRKSSGPAPISEVLAAGLVQLSGWDPAVPFVDPMCGSGTLVIEAAMLARNIPAGYYRKEFGFMKWKDFDETCWIDVKAGSDSAIRDVPCTISGSDRSETALRNAWENIVFAGLDKVIRTELSSFEDFMPPPGPGLLLTNPPYDERIALDDSIAFYRKIGDVLKAKYSGYDAWLISSDLNALKFVGLRPSRKITVFNGPLECRFMRFSMYTGKKQ